MSADACVDVSSDADGSLLWRPQLSRELQDIMKAQDLSLSADAVGDDVYQWNLWLGGFAPNSPLGQVQGPRPVADQASLRQCTPVQTAMR